jgi:fluoride exporter
MAKSFLLVFAGGAIGAVAREILMLLVPTLSRGFPLDILAANLIASLLIGFNAGRHSRGVASDGRQLFFSTGIAGGLSTFSSFAYASSVLLRGSTTGALVAVAYVLTSLGVGYAAVSIGLKLGRADRMKL